MRSGDELCELDQSQCIDVANVDQVVPEACDLGGGGQHHIRTEQPERGPGDGQRRPARGEEGRGKGT